MLHLLTVLFLLLGLSTATLAEPAEPDPIDITTSEVLDLSAAIMWCATKPNLGIAAVSNGGCRFLPVRDKSDLTPGISRDAYWLRFSLHNNSAEPSLRWLRVGHPRLNSVSLFRLEANGAWTAIATGLSVPARDRPVLAVMPILPINLAANATQTYYVRISSETAIVLNSVLVTPRAQVISSRQTYLVTHLALGAVILAGVFCLIIYANTGHTGLLFFSGTLLSVAVNDAGYTGLTAVLLWPADLAFPMRSNVISAFVGVVCFAAFILSFIPPHPRVKRLKSVLFIQFAILALVAIWALAIDFQDALPYLTAMVASIVLVLAFLIVSSRLIMNSPEGRLLVLGISPVLLLILLRLMGLLGLRPYDRFYEVGFSWALALLSPLIISGLLQQANDLRRRLNAADAERSLRSEIMAHISHDFRTPLNVIIQYADLVARGSSRVGSHEAMQAIKQSGYDLLAMIDAVLAYVRPDAKDIELQYVDTPLATFLSEIEARGRHLANLNGNTFSIEVDDAVPSIVRLDPLRLKQVLNNLIGNAHKYTKNGSVILSCHAERRDAGRRLLTFSVQDTGIGIPPEDQIRIFAPYERGGAVGMDGASGFGIGLALCQKLVGLMGSEIRVSSSPGRGSTFSFTLSCEVCRDAAPPRPSLADCTSRPRPTLLLVDDDPIALELMAMLLSPYEFVLLRARSGTDAARHWSCKIDLVITDQFMADGDGWTVLAQAATRNVPTLLVSAAPPRRPPDLSEDVEFADVFQKPVDSDALLAAIRRLLPTVRIEDRRTEHAVAAEATRPSEEIIAPLRQLIREGAVTKIDLWVRDAEQRHPSHRDFWSSIRASNARLDFARLHALLGDCSEGT